MPTPAENIRIRLTSIDDFVVNIPVPDRLSADDISAESLRIHYNVHVTVDRPQSRVDVKVTLGYSVDAGHLYSATLGVYFDVVDLASYITTEDGKEGFHIESDFFPMLINIAFGTARGYIASELKDTALASFPFPMIAMDMVQKNTTYQLL